MRRTGLLMACMALAAALLALTGAALAQGDAGPDPPTPDPRYECVSPPHQIPPPDLAYNQKPYIIRVNPDGGCEITDTTPTVRATVGDDTANLRKRDIRFYFDGDRKRTFDYSCLTDRLAFVRGRPVALGAHTVKIVAVDRSGDTIKKRTKRWTFEVVTEVS